MAAATQLKQIRISFVSPATKDRQINLVWRERRSDRDPASYDVTVSWSPTYLLKPAVISQSYSGHPRKLEYPLPF